MSGLFLGKTVDGSESFELASKRLRTHGVVVGMTGSGKTGLCLVLLGLVVLVALPHLTVVARQVDGQVSVTAWSFNRLDAVDRLRDELASAGRGSA